ncbi:hypothetical protein ACFOLJ_14400 [Rugamonas sp. CCM 8940]|uniref:hypothetical protein n=1 Tax=Rugamonas sp. CCM 8940 TaxID=2765359 RepID=UPI0018F5DABA|nr:hypothetical protein [Rugamonas sp. CCM 8940]MBJ7312021.1 hypothetical protein [Rugamonas sp. CCM 8940]
MAIELDFSLLVAAVNLDDVLTAVLAVSSTLAGLFVAKRGIFSVMRIIEPYDGNNKYHNGARGDYCWE